MARLKSEEITLNLFQVAQNDVFHVVNAAFQALLIESGPEFDIEYERFRIWGEVTGIGNNCEQIHRSSHWRGPRVFKDMQSSRECLHGLRLELEAVIEVLRSNKPTPYRIYHHLRKIVDNMWDMQAVSVQQAMTSTLENRILCTEDTNRLGSIEATFCGVDRDAVERAQAEDIIPKAREYRHIGLLAAMKQVASALDHSVQPSKNMLLEQDRMIGPYKPFHWHHTGLFRAADGSEKQVLVELLEYDVSWIERIDELIQRVENVACLRAVSSTSLAFPVLACAGYYHDLAKHAFGIVYYFPPAMTISSLSKPNMEKPTSLRDILTTVRSRRHRPSLDQVFHAALRLINMVVTMHRASWLHKSISSYNIIFFPERFQSIAEAMTSPYFIGFNYSRLSLETAFSQGPNQQLEYQHPEYLRGPTRFCQEYEYYSVGLVLMELGFWAPLEVITGDILGKPVEMVVALTTNYVPVLKTYMGSAYGDAVATCLNGDFGGSENPAEVREAFEERVLVHIERHSH